MGTTDSSAVIRFIAESQRNPVDRGIFARKYAPPMPPVVLTARPNPWRARLAIAASLVAVGLAGGLYASQTGPGRWLVEAAASSRARTPVLRPATPPPAAPLAAAIAPCPPAAPLPALATVAPAQIPTPVIAPAVAVAVAMPSVEPAPELAATSTRERPRREGILRIRSKPACDITIDGHKTGLRTPQRSIKLKPGKHTITLVDRKHHIRQKLSVRIKPGKTTRVTRDLRHRQH